MLEIDAEQARRFAGQGFLTVKRLVDEETVARLRVRFDKLFAGEFETGVSPDEVNWQAGSGDETLTRQICNGWRADRAIAEIVLREDFGRAAAQLGGWPGARVMTDNVLWKPPGARPLLYHQDSAYLDWFRPSDLLSLWIALDETSAEGGTLEFAPGSHRWRRSRPEGEFHGPEDYRRYLLRAAAAEGVANVEDDIAYAEVPAGGGSFHHGWVWHGSGYNRSSRPRRTLVLHAMRSDAEFNPARLASGTGAIYSRYKRLGDNVMDENYFPVIWRADGYRTPAIERYVAAT
ncbi:MAG: phytanoyl-CoA dioxygenase family protein [Alphaproteobacteria bacterium]